MKSQRSNHFVGFASPSDSQADDTSFHLFTVSSGAQTFPINVEVLVSTTPVMFQVGTGASLSIVNFHDYQKFLAESTPLMPTWRRGTFGNGGTSAHQPSESSDSSSTHNFRGGDCGRKQTLCLSRRSCIHSKISTRSRSI